MAAKERDWTQFALLAIDLQRDFWSEDLARSYPDFPGNVKRLFSLCRNEGVEVIHLRAEFEPDESDWMPIYKLGRKPPCIKGTPGVETLPFALEEPGETVIVKQAYDGFHTPELTQLLQDRRKRFVLTAGLVTSICVLLTTISATELGLLAAVVEDCCADEQEIHNRVLEHYGFMFDRVRSDSFTDRYPKWREALMRLDS